MTSQTFAACLAITLAYEGGKADDPRDPGGRTNKGITQATYDSTRRARGLPRRDVFAITDAEVAAIYEHDYWIASTADRQPVGLDLSLFDGAVNSGVGQGRKWLAKALLAGTIADQIHAFARVRLSMLQALRQWRTFGKGWAARVAGVEAKALRLHLAAAGAADPSAALQAKAVTIGATAATARTQAKLGVGAAVAAGTLGTIGAAHPGAATTVGVAALLAAAWRGFESWALGHRAAALAAEA